MPAPALRPPIPGCRRERPIRPRRALAVLAIATGLTAALTTPAGVVAARRAVKGKHGALQRAIVRSINSARAQHHLPPVRFQARLARAAAAQSADQLRGGRLSHESADGTSFDQRLRRSSSARWIGETIAWLTAGQAITAGGIVGMWLSSPPHRHLLMDGRFRRIGVGARSGSVGGQVTTVVTADFASAR
jgi:uncharacterized protein YkwD